MASRPSCCYLLAPRANPLAAPDPEETPELRAGSPAGAAVGVQPDAAGARAFQGRR